MKKVPEQTPTMIFSLFGSWHEMWSCTHGPVNIPEHTGRLAQVRKTVSV